MRVLYRGHLLENRGKHLRGALGGIDLDDVLGRIAREERTGLFLVNIPAMADDLFARIIGTVLLQSPAPQALDHLLLVGTDEMHNLQHLDMSGEQLGLLGIAGNSIENEQVGIGLVVVENLPRVHVLLPELYGDVVRYEGSARGVLADLLAQLGVDIDGAENIAAGEVLSLIHI